VHPREADLDALLGALLDAGVEFIVVGGAAAVLHGAPTSTLDLDIVHRRTAANVALLLGVLEDLDTRFRDPMGRILRPNVGHLMGTGQLNLSTEIGPLDALCKLPDGRGYEELVDKSDVLADGAQKLLVLDLPTLIAVKAEAGRAKDRVVVPILVALLKERGPASE
jgi:hypothetical protein